MSYSDKGDMESGRDHHKYECVIPSVIQIDFTHYYIIMGYQIPGP